MTEATIEDLRKLLQEYTVINNGYTKALATKDDTILRQNTVIDGLRRRIEELENAYELPKGGEGSQ